MPRLESKTLGETAHYGINLMEISNLHPEADSSCASISPEYLLRLVATGREIKVQEGERVSQTRAIPG